MPKIQYIQVILPLRLDWEPYYSVSEAYDVEIGTRVKVRFGPKTYTGVVSTVNAVPDMDTSRIIHISGVETSLQPITPEELQFWRFLSEYYLCTIGEVYRMACPALKISAERSSARTAEKAAERWRKSMSAALEKREKLSERMNARTEMLIEERLRIKNKKKQNAGPCQDSKKAIALAGSIEKLKSEYAKIEAEIAFLENCARQTADQETEMQDPPILTEAQAQSASAAEKSFKQGKPALLHGITGSGKTEIYISLALKYLAQGKSVLYLIPEIAISSQIENRLRGYFGESLHVVRSSETPASRQKAAEAARNGHSIIFGTRSALFLPFRNLGLIIVDEEHDSSFKQQDNSPRYNTRDAAVMLSHIHHCGIILGSATPSLESMYNCLTGKFSYIPLTERYFGGDGPETIIIDTISERRKNGMVGSFSRKLIDLINSTLSRGEQVMILRNHRSWSPALQCTSCGEIPKCRHCNVPLSLHRDNNDILLCHYCGTAYAYTGKCSKCGGELKPIGTGTQKIEEEAAVLFPSAVIDRLDGDTIKSKSRLEKTIMDFSTGNTDILIGTQIIGKGFDFKDLSLVAVIQADSLLGIQDFRADEKAMQSLEQFRGRTSRTGKPGTIAVQTSQPDHYVYKQLLSPAQGFMETQLTERKTFGYPPYSRIIGITVKDTDESAATEAASAIAAKLKEILKASTAIVPTPGSTMLIGPYAPAIDKIADTHIRQIRILLPRDSTLARRKALLHKTVSSFTKYLSSTSVSIDVDPV